MTGQCATCRLRSGSQSRVCGSKLSLRLAWVVEGARLQLFQPQLQLLDLPVQFLRLAPKLHAPQLGNQQLQMLDLALVREQLLMLREDQRLQSSLIQQIQVGKGCVGSSHTPSMPSTLHRKHSASHKKLCKSRRGTQIANCGSAVRTGRRQSMPSNSIDNCARVSETVPSVACGQMNRPRSRRLANRQSPSPSHHSTLIRSPRRPRSRYAFSPAARSSQQILQDHT